MVFENEIRFSASQRCREQRQELRNLATVRAEEQEEWVQGVPGVKGPSEAAHGLHIYSLGGYEGMLLDGVQDI